MNAITKRRVVTHTELTAVTISASVIGECNGVTPIASFYANNYAQLIRMAIKCGYKIKE